MDLFKHLHEHLKALTLKFNKNQYIMMMNLSFNENQFLYQSKKIF